MNIKSIKNFLYYNWIKLAAVIFVLIFIAVTVRQCQNRHELDFGIMYAGSEAISQRLPDIEKALSEKVDFADVDDDGLLTVRAKSITIPESREHAVEQQVMEQIQVEIIAGDYLIYVLTEKLLMKYAVDESFMDITKYAEGSEGTLSYDNGGVYAVPISGIDFFENIGIPTEGMYIALRACPEGKEESLEYKNALKALEFILNGGR